MLTLWGQMVHGIAGMGNDGQSWHVQLHFAASPRSNSQGPEDSGKICVAKPVGSLQGKGSLSRSGCHLDSFMRHQKQMPAWKQGGSSLVGCATRGTSGDEREMEMAMEGEWRWSRRGGYMLRSALRRQ